MWMSLPAKTVGNQYYEMHFHSIMVRENDASNENICSLLSLPPSSIENCKLIRDITEGRVSPSIIEGEVETSRKRRSSEGE
jgi:hypothetical protein